MIIKISIPWICFKIQLGSNNNNNNNKNEVVNVRFVTFYDL